jgi:curli biogenesis system outer membrane secretion channel CsgG
LLPVLALLLLAIGSARAAPYEGLKKTIAVDVFQAAEAVGGSVTADGLTSMLTDALAHDGRFVVVERRGSSACRRNRDSVRAAPPTPKPRPSPTS